MYRSEAKYIQHYTTQIEKSQNFMTMTMIVFNIRPAQRDIFRPQGR